ncbi:MAG: M28 family peptidase [Flavobacteriales bacterium]|nr:M28 family peptidase [Flavobacteriales bacterium]
MKKLVLIIGALCAGVASFAQDSLAMKYAATITPEELSEHLYILASDKFQGRETGEEGQKMAADFIANYYAGLGVQPVVEGSYFQEFPLRSERTVNASMKVGDETMAFSEDFYFFPGFDASQIDAQAIFLGYGIDSELYNDYEGVDVKGKVLFVLSGEPMNKEGISLVTNEERVSEWSGDWRVKRDAAQQKGARALVVVNDDYDKYLGRIKYWLENPGMRLDMEREEKEEVLPTFFIKPAALQTLFDEAKVGKLSKFKKKISAKGTPQTKAFKLPVSINIKREQKQFTSENILCYIPGSDPLLKDELVVITSHYDHVGMDGDKIFNGADDDGSGTVTVMEIAEAFKMAADEGNGPRRSVLLMNVSGEEKGLLGSEWYVTHPIFDLKKTVANLNVDMIGRKDADHEDGNYIYVIGSDKLSTELHDISENANSTYTNIALDYTYNDPNDPNRFYYRSDHYNFAKNKIPVIFYFSGVHEDYHQPTDTPDKIMYEKTAVIGQLIFYTAWDLANRDKKIVVDVVSDFE